MDGNSIIPSIKVDLMTLIKNLEFLKSTHQNRAIVNNVLSSANGSLELRPDNLNGSSLGKLIQSLPVLMNDIKIMPDLESKIKHDNNFVFNHLVSKAIKQFIDDLHIKFYEIHKKDMDRIIQNQIESEKTNDEKFKQQLMALQQIQDERQKAQLFIMLATLEAMKQQYQYLQQREKELTIELKKDVSALVGQTFTQPDGKPLPQEVQDSISDKIVNFQKEKFIEIKAEMLKEIDQKNKGKPYEVGKFIKDQPKDINTMVFDSLKWKAANKDGITKIVNDECIKANIKMDPVLLESQVAAFVQKEMPIVKDKICEIAEGRNEREVIKDNYKDELNKVNSLVEKSEAKFNFSEDDMFFDDFEPVSTFSTTLKQ
jgi:hypothetical protein